MQIIIQPIQTEIANDILNLLSNFISQEFSGSNITIGSMLKFNIHNFIDKSRNQIRSPDLLNWILTKIKPTKRKKILLICDMDAYSNDLNFVFGEAYIGGSIAAVYLPRLREFYGLKSDELLFHERIVKEAIHELGHSFGLSHCENKRCVMHFSNSLYDTDFKGKNLCSICRNNLRYRSQI